VVGDRAVEALLRRAETRLQAGGEVLDVAVQRAEVTVEPGGVRDEVARAVVPQDDPLVAAQARQSPRHDDHREERDHRDGGAGHGDDPGGGRQFVHGREG
jgi:hypothetical protein